MSNDTCPFVDGPLRDAWAKQKLEEKAYVAACKDATMKLLKRLPGGCSVLLHAQPETNANDDIEIHTTYKNKDDFYIKFPDTAYNNIGSQMNPLNYGNACLCHN